MPDEKNNLPPNEKSGAPLRLTASDFPSFQYQRPWWGPDLQMIHNKLFAPPVTLDDHARQSLILPLDDGSGDALAATLFTPATQRQNAPLVILVHGLGGSAASGYVQVSASHLLENGYSVLTVNMRGVDDSGPLCQSFNHPGRNEDVRGIIKALGQSTPPVPLEGGVVLVGFSLGGNIILKFLGTFAADYPVRAAVVVSAPLDLYDTSRCLLRWRNYLHQWYILRKIKETGLRKNSDLTPAERELVRNAASVWDIDDRVVAPRLGFEGAEPYYAEHSSKNYLDEIRTPTLVIHALDDPIVPGEPIHNFAWDRNPYLIPLIAEGGGHNGFHGQGHTVPWRDRCIVRFLTALEASPA